MNQILIYSDSLTWGIIPGTRQRLTFFERWPGIFESHLQSSGVEARVIENCLNGRRTVWSDPFKDGRNGALGLAEAVEMNSPLALVILMLGTNDFQSSHDNSAWLSAQGVSRLVQIVRAAPIEPGMPSPQIMIVCPPRIVEPKGVLASKFSGAQNRYGNLPGELEELSRSLKTHYFDSNQVVSCSEVDGIHLDKKQHLVLGQALAGAVCSANIF